VHVAIVEERIDVAAVLARVGAPEDGAVLLFLGNVRNRNDGRAVTGIRYEGYREMAEPLLHEIAGEARERWGIERVALVHRLGRLDVGETSVVVALSSGHRAEAYEASRYVMEEIKKRLPVWKHEEYADGEAGWVAGRDPGR
jgi:molybdopterin synthase catalytic subunit